MLHEFALDPRAICDRQSARYFFDACRAEKGRLVSQFPNKWKRMVFEHCQSVIPDGSSLKYIEERLRQMDGNIIRVGRTYNPDQDWVVNAVVSHGEKPFRAIISPKPGPGVLPIEVDEDTPAWKTEVCISVLRRKEDMVDGCRGLLRNARELIFVDPYFDGSTAQVLVLIALLNEGLSGFPLERIEFHVKARIDSDAYGRRLKQDVLRRLPKLPVPLHIIRWQDADETLHDRYILTDIAGVNIAQGLSECRAEESDTTDIALLGKHAFERRRHQYSAGNDGCFKFVDGWVFENGLVSPVVCGDGVFERSSGSI